MYFGVQFTFWWCLLGERIKGVGLPLVLTIPFCIFIEYFKLFMHFVVVVSIN